MELRYSAELNSHTRLLRLGKGSLDGGGKASLNEVELRTALRIDPASSFRIDRVWSYWGRVYVSQTDGVSAAFIKELMRRAAQCMLQEGHSQLAQKHVQLGLEELLFAGGSLNAKLLGARVQA
jgi:hypothetical protein